jgi:hypothetical protein
MTRDDIIRLALEHFGAVLKPSDLEVQLAVLAVAAEREECAKVCDRMAEEYAFEPFQPDPLDFSDAIRARGET